LLVEDEDEDDEEDEDDDDEAEASAKTSAADTASSGMMPKTSPAVNISNTR